MTMSEVVAVWGKPPILCSDGATGSQFRYLSQQIYTDLVLSFLDERLNIRYAEAGKS
jgi:hypothetical protein